MLYKSLCVVPTDWGDLRDQIFSRTGFAPSDPAPSVSSFGGACAEGCLLQTADSYYTPAPGTHPHAHPSRTSTTHVSSHRIPI